MVATVATVKDIEYYDKEEVKQSNTKKGRKDKENYYSESGTSQSVYLGSGSKILKLNNQPVGQGDLRKLISGINPLTNTEFFTKKNAKFHATDMCLSAPKDFTLLAEFDIENRDKYQEIFDRAVDRTINKLEEKVYRRITKKGIHSFDCKLIVLSFSHKTARQVGEERPDPQWHRHNVILRRCFDSEGNVRTIDNFGIFNNQKLMGAIFRSELANGLRELGYIVEQNKENYIDDNFKRVQVNSFNVKGITQSQRDKFSKRALQINEVSGNQASSIKKFNVAQNIKRAKQLWDKDLLQSIWLNDANNVGLNNEFFNDIKSLKPIQFNQLKLEEFLIKSSMTKGVLYESKLRLRLQEYEQFTGINADKYFQRLIDTKAIEKVSGYTYKCNLPLNKYETQQKIIQRRFKDNERYYGGLFTSFLESFMNQAELLLLSYLIFKAFEKDKKKENNVEPKKENKKEEKPQIIQTRKEVIGLSMAEIEEKLRDTNLTHEDRKSLLDQLDQLYIQLEEDRLNQLNNKQKKPKFK